MIYLVTLPERLDTERLNQAFQAVQQTHDAFRLRMTQSGSRFRHDRRPGRTGTPPGVGTARGGESIAVAGGRSVDRPGRGGYGLAGAGAGGLDLGAAHPFRLLYCKGEGRSWPS